MRGNLRPMCCRSSRKSSAPVSRAIMRLPRSSTSATCARRARNFVHRSCRGRRCVVPIGCVMI